MNRGERMRQDGWTWNDADRQYEKVVAGLRVCASEEGGFVYGADGECVVFSHRGYVVPNARWAEDAAKTYAEKEKKS